MATVMESYLIAGFKAIGGCALADVMVDVLPASFNEYITPVCHQDLLEGPPFSIKYGQKKSGKQASTSSISTITEKAVLPPTFAASHVTTTGYLPDAKFHGVPSVTGYENQPIQSSWSAPRNEANDDVAQSWSLIVSLVMMVFFTIICVTRFLGRAKSPATNGGAASHTSELAGADSETCTGTDPASVPGTYSDSSTQTEESAQHNEQTQQRLRELFAQSAAISRKNVDEKKRAVEMCTEISAVNKKLRDRNEKLEHCILPVGLNIRRIMHEVKLIERERKDNARMMSEKNQEISNRDSQISDLAMQAIDSDKTIKELKNQLQENQKALHAEQEQAEKNEKTMKSQKTEVEALRRQVKKADEKVKTAQEAEISAKDGIQSLSGQLRNERKATSAAKNAKDKAIEARQAMKEQKDWAEKTLSAESSKRREAEEQLTAAQKQASEKHEAMKMSAETISKLQDGLAAAQKQLAERAEAANTTAATIAKLESDLATKRDEIDEVDAQLADAYGQHDEEEARLRSELDDARSELDDAARSNYFCMAALQGVCDQLKAKEAEIAELKAVAQSTSLAGSTDRLEEYVDSEGAWGDEHGERSPKDPIAGQETPESTADGSNDSVADPQPHTEDDGEDTPQSSYVNDTAGGDEQDNATESAFQDIQQRPDEDRPSWYERLSRQRPFSSLQECRRTLRVPQGLWDSYPDHWVQRKHAYNCKLVFYGRYRKDRAQPGEL